MEVFRPLVKYFVFKPNLSETFRLWKIYGKIRESRLGEQAPQTPLSYSSEGLNRSNSLLPGSGRFSAGGGRRSCRASIKAGGFPADPYQISNRETNPYLSNLVVVVGVREGDFVLKSPFLTKEYPYRRLIKGSIFVEKSHYAQVYLWNALLLGSLVATYFYNTKYIKNHG